MNTHVLYNVFTHNGPSVTLHHVKNLFFILNTGPIRNVILMILFSIIFSLLPDLTNQFIKEAYICLLLS